MNSHNIHVIGIGGLGSRMIAFIQKKGIKAKYSYINDEILSDIEPETNFVEFIPKSEFIYIRNGDKIRSTDWTEKVHLPDNVYDIITQSDKYIIITGLGGYTGTFVTEEVCKLLKASNKTFSIICSMPFNAEGRLRFNTANGLRQKFENYQDFHCFEQEQIVTKYGNMILSDALKKGDEELFLLFVKQYKSYINH